MNKMSLGTAGPPRTQSGVGLVEILVALLLAVILIGTLVVTYLANKQSYLSQIGTEGIQESARHAMDMILRDTRQAGFFGGHQGPIDQVQNALPPADVNCNKDTWAFAIAQRIYGLNDTNNDGTTTGDYTSTACLGGTYANGDVLVVRHATSTPLKRGDTLSASGIYLITDLAKAELFTGKTIPVNVTNWPDLAEPVFIQELIARAYFVGTSSAALGCPTGSTPGAPIRSLYRISTAGTGTIVKEEIVPGVEDFQIQFGMDTDAGDPAGEWKQADVFLDANDAALDWNKVVAVRVWLLVRSLCGESGYKNDQTYVLAGKNVGPFNDEIRRQLFSATILLRNRTPSFSG